MENNAALPQPQIAEPQIVDPRIESLKEVAKIPSADEVVRNANLRLAEQERLGRAQENLTQNATTAEQNAQKEEAALVEAKNKLSEAETRLKSVSREVTELSAKTNELEYKIAGKKNVLVAAELDLNKVDGKTTETNNQIEADLVQKIKLIDEEKRSRLGELYKEMDEEISVLENILEAEKTGVESARTVIGDAGQDDEGKWIFDENRTEALKNVTDSSVVEKIKQERVGGEMAVELTTGMIEKKVSEWQAAEQKIIDEAEAKKVSLGDEAKAEKISVIDRAEEEKQQLQELMDTTNKEIAVMIGQKEEAETQLSSKEEESEMALEEFEKLSEKVEATSAEITNFKDEISKNRDLLARVAEKMDSISEKGVSAARSLGELASTIENRINALGLKSAELQVKRIKYDELAQSEVYRSLESKIANIEKEYKGRVKEMERQIVEKNPEMFGFDAEDNLVSKVKGIESMFAMRAVTDSMSKTFGEATRQRESEYAQAHRKWTHDGWEQTEKSINLRKIIKATQLDEETKLNDALTIAKNLQATAEETFGPGVATQESASKQQNFLKRTKEFFGNIFKRK